MKISREHYNTAIKKQDQQGKLAEGGPRRENCLALFASASDQLKFASEIYVVVTGGTIVSFTVINGTCTTTLSA